ncbi:MAG: ATP-binding protein [Paludibacter sp.]
METTSTNSTITIFRTLNSIGKKFKSKKYSDKLINELQVELQEVSDYLGVTIREAIIFSIIFWLNSNELGHFDALDISRFLQCDMIEFLSYKLEIEQLIQKKILTKGRIHRKNKYKFLNYYYGVNSIITDSILSNESIPNTMISENIDIYQFVETVSDLIQKRNGDFLTTHELFEEVKVLEEENQHLAMVMQVNKSVKEIEDRTLWYEICFDLIRSEKSNVNIILSEIYQRVQFRLKKSKELIDGKHKLIELGWIELENGGFFSDAEITMTEKGRDLFLSEDASLYLKMGKDKKLITPNNIVPKSLYFDQNLESHLSFIRQSLDESSFVNLQNRLESKGLPRGMSVIFYGSPGTGKTESVYQLARQTGRSIMHVDISQSKSMWFGESEKRIKEIFMNYKTLCKSEGLKPILLFNEADAIFGKRKQGNASNVDQTENTIQNIILEEMEKLEGILIATTNLNQNLDAAFERRFLFKVKFENPSLEAKQKIWMSKLETLTDIDAMKLATDYSFSGGEIENIVRKVTIDEVLNGEIPDMQQLIGHCNNEKFASSSTNKRLGF